MTVELKGGHICTVYSLKGLTLYSVFRSIPAPVDSMVCLLTAGSWIVAVSSSCRATHSVARRSYAHILGVVCFFP